MKEQVSTQVVIQAIEKKTKSTLIKLENFEVVDNATYDKVATMVKELKTYKKEAENQEATILNPLQAAVKATKDLFKPFYLNVANIELLTKSRMITFLDNQKAKELKLKEKFEDGSIKKVSTLITKVADLQVSSNSASQRTIKEIEIVDLAAIPREYLVPDMVAIRKAFKEGIKVEGCKEVTKISIAI